MACVMDLSFQYVFTLDVKRHSTLSKHTASFPRLCTEEVLLRLNASIRTERLEFFAGNQIIGSEYFDASLRNRLQKLSLSLKRLRQQETDFKRFFAELESKSTD